MDSTNGPYMTYGNNNNVDDLSSFFDGVQAYATNNNDTPFDSALFEDAFPSHAAQQQSQQSGFNQAQRQTQSQSPALPQFKPSQSAYPTQQYSQNVYNPQAIAQQGYDQHLLARPTHSPASFDQYSYQQSMNYGQPNFDYRFNSFQPQTQRQSTPTQAFRPQVAHQPSTYMSASRSPQTQAHPSQIQGSNGMSYAYPPAQHYVTPGMLNNEHQMYPNTSNVPGIRQMNASPYLSMGDPTVNPNNIPMQNSQVQQSRSQSGNIETMNGIQQQQQYQQQQQQQQQHLHSMIPGSAPIAPAGAGTNGQILKPRPQNAAKTSGSASSSEDDLEIEDEPPEIRPAAITISKPDTYKERLLWEVVDAVWTPRNRPASPDKIVAAIKYVGEAVRGLREQWKSQNEKLKKAELPNSETSAHAPQLKQLVGNLREVMETLAAKVTKWGHPSILKRLGENELLLSALYSFLLDRVNAEDYNSTLVTSILSLGTKLQTVDEEKLEKVKWTKILSRIVKKSTNESKAFGQQIIANAKKATARKNAGAAGQGPASPAGSSSGQVAGTKRAREGSDAPQQMQKKANVKPSSKPLSVQLEEQRRLKEKEKEKARLSAAKDVKSDKPKPGAAPVPARPKVAAPLPPKASPFASLMSASKKPGTTNAERLAGKGKPEPGLIPVTPATVVVKKDTKPKVEPQPIKTAIPPPSSSFLGFIADMDKPKDVPKARIEEIPDETPEARVKRLRKESRKRLRVSWKSDQELVETRIFEHDPDEETGHEDSMMRDVGDTAKEGEMLKRHHTDIDEMDEDDDEIDFYTPYEIDFSDMKDDGNFVKTGGVLTPESTSRDAQDTYESGRMMAVYASGERPNTPKEPPADADDEDFNPVADFGYPTQPFVRQREQAVMARRQAYQPAAQVQSNGFDLASAIAGMQTSQPASQGQPQDWLRAFTQQTQSQPQVQQPGLAGLDISKLLAAVSQTQPVAYQPPAPTPQPTVSTTNLAPNVAALLAGFNQPAQQSLPIGQGGNPNPWPGAAADQGQQDTQEKSGKRKHKASVPLDANGLPINYKTQVCSFWLEGKCTKGDACTYRHDRG